MKKGEYMKQETYYCDLCKKQVDKENLHIGHFVNVLNSFADDVNESRYTDVKLDLCDTCLDLCTPVMRYKGDNFKVRDYNKNGYYI
jgi:hypothetical protein